MQGIANSVNKEDLFHLLDIAKMGAQSDITELDDETDQKILDEDSEIDRDKIDFNAAEIKDLLVSLVI